MTATLLPFSPHPALWRGNSLAAPVQAGVPTGFAALDAELPGGGWPVGALTEIYAAEEGIGELTLLLPLLVRSDPRWIAWIAPPHLPYAPALARAGVELARLLVVAPRSPAETLWATRQAIASNACAAVLGWLPKADAKGLRRLQLAASGRRCVALLFRPLALARQATPAPLKLLLEAAGDRLQVTLLKRRGAPLEAPLTLDIERPAHVVAGPASTPPAAAGSSAWLGRN